MRTSGNQDARYGGIKDENSKGLFQRPAISRQYSSPVKQCKREDSLLDNCKGRSDNTDRQC